MRRDARRRLVALAKRAHLVREESATAWIESVVQSAPSLVAEAGVDDVLYVADVVWNLPVPKTS